MYFKELSTKYPTLHSITLTLQMYACNDSAVSLVMSPVVHRQQMVPTYIFSITASQQCFLNAFTTASKKVGEKHPSQ